MEELTRREIEDCQIAIGILLDERTSGLDEKRWNDLWEKLERMARSLPNYSVQRIGGTCLIHNEPAVDLVRFACGCFVTQPANR